METQEEKANVLLGLLSQVAEMSAKADEVAGSLDWLTEVSEETLIGQVLTPSDELLKAGRPAYYFSHADELARRIEDAGKITDEILAEPTDAEVAAAFDNAVEPNDGGHFQLITVYAIRRALGDYEGQVEGEFKLLSRTDEEMYGPKGEELEALLADLKDMFEEARDEAPFDFTAGRPTSMEEVAVAKQEVETSPMLQ